MKTIAATTVIQGLTLLFTLAIVTFVLLSVFDVVKICGKQGSSAAGKSKGYGKRKSTKRSKKAAVEEEQEQEDAAEQEEQEVGEQAADADTVVEIEKPLETQMADFKNGKLKNLIIIIGQKTCPACVHTKRYFKEKGLGNHAIFVDLADPKGGEAMKQLPKDVVSKLQGGVPCMVAYQHGKGAQYAVTGFSEPEVEKLVKAAGIKAY
jgi:glutaredoxin